MGGQIKVINLWIMWISWCITIFALKWTNWDVDNFGGNVYKLLGIMWTGKKSNTFFVQSAWLTISLGENRIQESRNVYGQNG